MNMTCHCVRQMWLKCQFRWHHQHYNERNRRPSLKKNFDQCITEMQIVVDTMTLSTLWRMYKHVTYNRVSQVELWNQSFNMRDTYWRNLSLSNDETRPNEARVKNRNQAQVRKRTSISKEGSRSHGYVNVVSGFEWDM